MTANNLPVLTCLLGPFNVYASLLRFLPDPRLNIHGLFMTRPDLLKQDCKISWSLRFTTYIIFRINLVLSIPRFWLFQHSRAQSLQSFFPIMDIARKSVAPSSGDFWRQPATRYACGQEQEFWRKKSFSKIIITPLPRPRPALCKCVTSIIFQELLFLHGRLGVGVLN